jgi:menaquinone-dependent protoporphyrinogen oxidase
MHAAVFYATREGHTCRVAERIADRLRQQHVEAAVYDVRQLAAPIDWRRFDVAFVAASVHVGRHEPEMVAFVRDHRAELERLDAAFVSVSLSEAGAEDATATEHRRRQAAADVQRMIDDFVLATGWRSAHTRPVAGALAYRHYNVVIRFIMKRIARKAGGPTDTSRDHVLTDWAALDRFVDEMSQLAALRQPA